MVSRLLVRQASAQSGDCGGATGRAGSVRGAHWLPGEPWSLSLGDPDSVITLFLGVAATNRCCRFPSFGTTSEGGEYAYLPGDSWHCWLPIAPIHLATS